MNPQIARYVRCLHINYLPPHPKMRLPLDIDVGVNHSYQELPNPFLWSYELLGRALRQMINLKAFEWLFDKTPIFDVNSDVIRAFSNLPILEPVNETDGRFVSLFDTPIIN
ncbi:hypothetical protein Clacol_004986 [Clathrus columnatus]|uniref:Uncharacterized protein n=1 Tax=Clathrus columnatus TaxID=1419009 RepID=A0AAV5ABA4_9AGAM|nr:hypothetical protein Clacol_004986 [Clathrus columnatus]